MARRRLLAGAVVALVILGTIPVAYLLRERTLSSNELARVAYQATSELIDEAVAAGGLDSPDHELARRVAAALRDVGVSASVSIWRPLRPVESPPLAFRVHAGGTTAWMSPVGLPDPLAAMRTGVHHPIIAGPHRPQERHADAGVLADCLTNGYAHPRVGAPDLFDRLRNRTGGSRAGFEVLLPGDPVALDRFALEGRVTPAEALAPYGL
jgi:hypothetical protein